MPPLLLQSSAVNATVTMNGGTQYLVVDTPAIAYRKIISTASAPAAYGAPVQVAFTLYGIPPLQARGDSTTAQETVILDVSQVATVG